MAVTPTAPRPAMRPAAQQPKPKQSSGLLVGLIIAGVLAVAGLGGAGFLFSKQGGLTTEIGTHQTALLSAATSLGIAVDTNTPVDWSDLWSKLTASITAMKNEGERQTARIDEMTQELEAAAGLQATLTRVQGDAQRSAQQATELTAQLDALKQSSATQVNELQAQLEAAKQAAAQTAASLESLKAAAPAPADQPPVAPEGQAAPEATAPATPAGEPKAESATTAATAKGKPAPAAKGKSPKGATDELAEPAPPIIGEFTFPRRSELLSTAKYDGNVRTLELVLRDGTVLNYTDFPQELYEGFISIASHDTFYRMRILGNYPVNPDDKAAVRGLRR